MIVFSVNAFVGLNYACSKQLIVNWQTIVSAFRVSFADSPFAVCRRLMLYKCTEQHWDKSNCPQQMAVLNKFYKM